MMNDDSTSSHDMVSISINGTEPSSREYFENRRRRQAKENVEMLGVLESMDDDDPYLENTLASLEYSAATSQGSALREIVDNTVPYRSNLTRWRYRVRNTSLQALRRGQKLWERYHIVVQKYGPYVLILLAYLSIRFLWQNPTEESSNYSDTEKITLNTYQDIYLNQLQSRAGGSSDKNGAAAQRGPVGSQTDINIDNEIPEYPPLHKFKYQIEETQDYDPMELPPKQAANQEANANGWNDFKERVKKLREISERGRAALNLSGHTPPQQGKQP